jgi:hypothetical protein
MTTPNTIIADLSHEIDRLHKIGNLMLETLISAESFVAKFEYSTFDEVPSLLGNIRYAIDEAKK